MPRKPKLTQERQARIVEALELGMKIKDVCAIGDISQDTYFSWIKRGENGDGKMYSEFSEAVKKAVKGLTPSLVVEHAKPKNSILHDYFTWDDKAAGRAWRLTQARYLIRQLVVIKVVDGDRPEPVRAFVSVIKQDAEETKTRHAYFAVADAIRNKSYRQQLLDEALQEIRAWRMKYARFQELAQIFDAIDIVEMGKSSGVNGRSPHCTNILQQVSKGKES